MTTIRDELDFKIYGEGSSTYGMDLTLEVLGIDPDLPTEWATVDRCLGWLREQGIDMSGFGSGVYATDRDDAVSYDVQISGPDGLDRHWHCGPTLHAALVAACRAVQDGES